MELGLKRGTVALEPHNDEWEKSAKETIHVLETILGSDAVAMQHVGSTAIKEIMAKPIIDIAVAVKDFGDVLRHEEALKDAGIIFRGEDVAEQLLFVMGDFKKDTRTHHIHVVKWDEQQWRNYLNFRDYLNANPLAAVQYSKLKEKLAAVYPDNRKAYTEGKQQLIDEILAQAAKWREERQINLNTEGQR